MQDKLRILAEIDRAPSGGTGAILRREGPYSSTLSDWPGLRATGALGGLTPTKRGPKPVPRNPMAAELAHVKRENARLVRRLEHAETISTDLLLQLARVSADIGVTVYPFRQR
jgi:transposase